jgi:Aldehyde oxidase and xanthine dehydrogenase, a/b hammerhead domain
MGETTIGKGILRFEDLRLIQGAGRYVDDIKFPGMIYGVVLRSSHAHAKICSIDIAAAKTAPGVLAVLTSADVKASGFGDLPIPTGLKRRNGEDMYEPRYPILAEDHVRWVGDCVAFVVAETVEQALDASELIQVEYEPLPSVTSTIEALRPDATRVWQDTPDNICFVNPLATKQPSIELSPRPTESLDTSLSSIASPQRVLSRVPPSVNTMPPTAAIPSTRRFSTHIQSVLTLRNKSLRYRKAKCALSFPMSVAASA